MRLVVVAFLVVSAALAGCASDENEKVSLVAFTATYAGPETNFTVELTGPTPFLDGDGAIRSAYRLAVRPPDSSTESLVQMLAEDASVLRQSSCWVQEEGACVHHRMTWPQHDWHATLGVGGLLWGDPISVDEGFLRVAAEGGTDFEQFYYEYRPGDLWPQRHVREVPSFDHEETLWSLVAVDVGSVLAPMDPRPPVTTPEPTTDGLFPGADKPLLDLPFTVAQGLETLRSHDEAQRILESGCVAGVFHRDSFGFPEGPLPVDPRRALPNGDYVDQVDYLLVDADGGQSAWRVELRRDILGDESLVAVRDDLVNPFTLVACADRMQATIDMEAFLVGLPPDLKQGTRQELSASWAGCCHYPRPEPHNLVYAVQWWTEGDGHFRSAKLDASTGWYLEISSKPGDRIDP